MEYCSISFSPQLQGVEGWRGPRSTGERRSSRLSGFALDPLDRAVCLAARGLLFRYLEVADLIDQEETSVGRECVEALRDAANCVDPAAYKGTEGENDKGAAAYRESIEQKAKLLERITRGEPIEDVLLSALASSE